MIQQGINVILYLEDKPLAGQQKIEINRSNSSIDITNKINGSWKESMPGLKSWSVNCSGCYIVNSESYKILEDCFMNDKEVQVEVQVGEKRLMGNALITDFPLGSSYDKYFKYQIQLLGSGELK